MVNNSLTIIIPAYNEEQAIRSTLTMIIPFAEKNKWEIIVVNDGSTDKTRPEAEYFENKIKLIDHPYNKGYGASLKTGIKNAGTELIALFDADGQHRIEDLEKLYDELGNYDMLIGERSKDSHSDWIRKPGKWILSITANFLTGRKIPDLNSGLRIIHRPTILKMLHLFPDGFSFSTTSTIAFFNMGFNVGYLPVITNKRIGKSTVKQIKHGSSTILLILRLVVLFNPLKVFIPISSIIFILGLLYEIVYGIILSNGIKLLPAGFFMLLTGVLIFFFGLVVDQLSEMRKNQL